MEVYVEFINLIQSYNRKKFKIKSLQIKETELRALGGFPKSGKLEGMPKTNQNTSSVENLVIKIQSLVEERITLEAELERERQVILKLIEKLNDLTAMEVLETKIFIKNAGWRFVSQKVFLSESRVRHIYQDAVEKINKVLEGENHGMGR